MAYSEPDNCKSGIDVIGDDVVQIEVKIIFLELIGVDKCYLS